MAVSMLFLGPTAKLYSGRFDLAPSFPPPTPVVAVLLQPEAVEVAGQAELWWLWSFASDCITGIVLPVPRAPLQEARRGGVWCGRGGRGFGVHQARDSRSSVKDHRRLSLQ